MLALKHRLRTARHLAFAFTLCPLAILALVIALPKDPTFAASDRFVATLFAGATMILGAIGLLVAQRRWRDLAIVIRYARATRAMRDTLQFLLHERQLARRGRLVLIASAGVAGGLYILAQWPQLDVLAPLATAFATLAGISVVLLVFQPLRARRHIINALYLRRYLRQQAQHVGYIPNAVSSPCEQNAPPVLITAPLKFKAGGFEWSFDDLQKNLIVFGQPGAGKTVCVLNALLEGVLASGPDDRKVAGLILDSKGVLRDTIGPLCQRIGRADDLYVLSPDSWRMAARTPASIAWNPLDTDDDALDVAARIITTMKLAGGVAARDSFFIDAARLYLRHSYGLIRNAAKPDAPSLLDLHALCAEPLDEPEYYKRLLGILKRKYRDRAPAEVDNAVAYFETEFRTLPDRQLAGVRSEVNHLADDFTSEPIAEMISGPSTIKIADVIDQEKLFYVHLPLAGRERMSRILTNLIRLEFLRRPLKERPSFLFADEFQTLFVSGEEHGDSDFFERSRESLHANIIAAQNMSSFLKKTPNRADVTNFLGLCAVKIFLRNAERETDEWASNLFGERSEIIVTASEAARLDGGFSRNQTSYSRSARSVRIVPPDAFAALAIPVEGDPERQFAESIVHLGSRAVTEKLDLSWRVHPFRP